MRRLFSIRRLGHDLLDVLTTREPGVEEYRLKWAMNFDETPVTFVSCDNLGFIDPNADRGKLEAVPGDGQLRIVINPHTFGIPDDRVVWFQLGLVKGGVEETLGAMTLVVPARFVPETGIIFIRGTPQGTQQLDLPVVRGLRIKCDGPMEVGTEEGGATFAVPGNPSEIHYLSEMGALSTLYISGGEFSLTCRLLILTELQAAIDASGAVAGGLQTTTVVVNVSNADAPLAGQVLTARSPTSALWLDPTGGPADALQTTGDNVVVAGAAPPTAGQVLTATSATAAEWQDPSGGGGGVATALGTTGEPVTVDTAEPPSPNQVLRAVSGTEAKWGPSGLTLSAGLQNVTPAAGEWVFVGGEVTLPIGADGDTVGFWSFSGGIRTAADSEQYILWGLRTVVPDELLQLPNGSYIEFTYVASQQIWLNKGGSHEVAAGKLPLHPNGPGIGELEPNYFGIVTEQTSGVRLPGNSAWGSVLQAGDICGFYSLKDPVDVTVSAGAGANPNYEVTALAHDGQTILDTVGASISYPGNAYYEWIYMAEPNRWVPHSSALSILSSDAVASALGQVTTSVSLNNHRINDLFDPAAPQDAATKAYVDRQAGGLRFSSSGVPAIGEWTFLSELATLPLGTSDGDTFGVSAGPRAEIATGADSNQSIQFGVEVLSPGQALGLPPGCYIEFTFTSDGIGGGTWISRSGSNETTAVLPLGPDLGGKLLANMYGIVTEEMVNVRLPAVRWTGPYASPLKSGDLCGFYSLKDPIDVRVDVGGSSPTALAHDGSTVMNASGAICVYPGNAYYEWIYMAEPNQWVPHSAASAMLSPATVATALGQVTTSVSLNNHRINDLFDPAAPQDAATKAYVDSRPSGGGLRMKEGVAGTPAAGEWALITDVVTLPAEPSNGDTLGFWFAGGAVQLDAAAEAEMLWGALGEVEPGQVLRLPYGAYAEFTYAADYSTWLGRSGSNETYPGVLPLYPDPGNTSSGLMVANMLVIVGDEAVSVTLPVDNLGIEPLKSGDLCGFYSHRSESVDVVVGAGELSPTALAHDGMTIMDNAGASCSYPGNAYYEWMYVAEANRWVPHSSALTMVPKAYLDSISASGLRLKEGGTGAPAAGEWSFIPAEPGEVTTLPIGAEGDTIGFYCLEDNAAIQVPPSTQQIWWKGETIGVGKTLSLPVGCYVEFTFVSSMFGWVNRAASHEVNPGILPVLHTNGGYAQVNSCTVVSDAVADVELPYSATTGDLVGFYSLTDPIEVRVSMPFDGTPNPATALAHDGMTVMDSAGASRTYPGNAYYEWIYIAESNRWAPHSSALTMLSPAAVATALGQVTTSVSLNNHRINNLFDPAAPQDAATKAYVDSAAGGVKGPTTSIDGRVAVYDGTTGSLLKGGTKLEADLVTGPASSTANRVPYFSGTTGKVLAESTLLYTNLVTQAANGTVGNVASFASNGKTLTDSTVPASRLELFRQFATNSANFTAAIYTVHLVDTSAGVVTATLPPISGNIYKNIVFKRIGPNDLIIDGAGAETIDGQATLTLTQNYEAAELVCHSSGWYRI